MAGGPEFWDRLSTAERRAEWQRQAGTRPLRGYPLREAVASEVRAIVSAGSLLRGGALAAEVSERLGAEGWVSWATMVERCEAARDAAVRRAA